MKEQRKTPQGYYWGLNENKQTVLGDTLLNCEKSDAQEGEIWQTSCEKQT